MSLFAPIQPGGVCGLGNVGSRSMRALKMFPSGASVPSRKLMLVYAASVTVAGYFNCLLPSCESVAPIQLGCSMRVPRFSFLPLYYSTSNFLISYFLSLTSVCFFYYLTLMGRLLVPSLATEGFVLLMWSPFLFSSPSRSSLHWVGLA